MNRRREFAVFALRPGRLPAGPGDVTGCGRLHPQHSPACTAVPRTGACRRDSPSSQWEAVVEVSLSPRGIVARLPATAGSVVHVDRSGCAIVAPPRSPLRRAGDCTCNTAYSIVKVRQGLSILPTLTCTKKGFSGSLLSNLLGII